MECKNCGQNILDENNFCSDCGEEVHTKRLTIKSVFSLFFSELLNYDNKLVKTFRHLFSKPELVINSYLNGFRKNYVNVITYLSLSITLIAIQFFILKNFYQELLLVDNNAGMPENMPIDMNYINEIMLEYQGILVIFLTPFTALASWITFIDKRKYNLAEHIVINVYPSAQFFIVWSLFTGVIILFNISFYVASQLSMIALFIYMLTIFKRLYNISFGSAFLRTIIYTIIYFVLYIGIMFVAGILIAIYLVSTGKWDPQTITV